MADMEKTLHLPRQMVELQTIP